MCSRKFIINYIYIRGGYETTLVRIFVFSDFIREHCASKYASLCRYTVRWYRTETAIISKNDTIKSVDESFTLYGLKPYFYTGDVFDATFDVTVDWHGCAVAAAFMPAVFDVYQYTNSEYSGKIIEKYPSLVGLIAVFRGSHHTGTTLGAEWTEDYMLMDGKIYLEVKVEYPKYYAYTITVYTETTVKKEIIEIAWAKARVGLSAELNVLNLVDVSYELAHVELGVEAQIIMSETTTSGYRYTVQFIVPVSSKITINYQACVNVTYVYIAHNENGPVPTSYEIGDKHSTALGPEGGLLQ